MEAYLRFIKHFRGEVVDDTVVKAASVLIDLKHDKRENPIAPKKKRKAPKKRIAKKKKELVIPSPVTSADSS